MQHLKNHKLNRKTNIKNDWRYQHQDVYLKGLRFTLVDYETMSENDHDHCEFCGEKFSIVITEALKKGYTDDSRYRWICEKCFHDFELELELKRK